MGLYGEGREIAGRNCFGCPPHDSCPPGDSKPAVLIHFSGVEFAESGSVNGKVGCVSPNFKRVGAKKKAAAVRVAPRRPWKPVLAELAGLARLPPPPCAQRGQRQTQRHQADAARLRHDELVLLEVVAHVHENRHRGIDRGIHG